VSDFEIHGADNFYRVSKALKAAGATGMRRELHNAMRRAARPLTKVAKGAAHEVFPKRGGLADREEKIPFRSTVKTSRDQHGVEIVAPGRFVAAKTTNEAGRFKKPVFGRVHPPLTVAESRKTWTWRWQEVPGSEGWFDRAMEGSAPLVRPELEKALDNVIDEVIRGAM